MYSSKLGLGRVAASHQEGRDDRGGNGNFSKHNKVPLCSEKTKKDDALKCCSFPTHRPTLQLASKPIFDCTSSSFANQAIVTFIPKSRDGSIGKRGSKGKAIAEKVDPTVEANYWRDAYLEQPYYSEDHTYEDYEPAYRSGWESYDPAVQLGWKEREAVAKKRWESEGGATSINSSVKTEVQHVGRSKGAMYLAGGTTMLDLMKLDLMKLDVLQPDFLVEISLMVREGIERSSDKI